MRILLKFSRESQIKYISHLDIQRLFQRALRRAKIPMEYSKGYNPHLLISFATAMPLGVCSRAEYVEIQTEKYINPVDVKNRLNEVLPSGIEILAAEELKDGYPNVGSVIALAQYSLDFSGENAQEIIKELLQSDEIVIEKKTKKGLAQVNVRKMIHSLSLQGDKITATLSLSNSESLRADKLAEILVCKGLCIGEIYREAIYIIKDGNLVLPL